MPGLFYIEGIALKDSILGTQALSKEMALSSRELSQVLSPNHTEVGLGRTLRSGSQISWCGRTGRATKELPCSLAVFSGLLATCDGVTLQLTWALGAPCPGWLSPAYTWAVSGTSDEQAKSGTVSAAWSCLLPLADSWLNTAMPGRSLRVL